MQRVFKTIVRGPCEANEEEDETDDFDSVKTFDYLHVIINMNKLLATERIYFDQDKE